MRNTKDAIDKQLAYEQNVHSSFEKVIGWGMIPLIPLFGAIGIPGGDPAIAMAFLGASMLGGTFYMRWITRAETQQELMAAEGMEPRDD